MKVVLFCGGLGLRLRDYDPSTPKPMVPLGNRPILWHIMRYYAHQGHKDFVLCLGYKANVVKEYFLNYNEAVSNDFVLSDGGRRLDLMSRDIDDWCVTFADTGLRANIGERLRAVRQYVAGEEIFLASYGDGLTDASMNELVEDFRRRDAVASFLSVHPTYSFHFVAQRPDGIVTSIMDVKESEIRINGGYFIFRQEIFDYLEEGEELVEEPFQRLIKEQRLIGYAFDGFWAPMDTLRDRQRLDVLVESGSPPWALWQKPIATFAAVTRH
ncbi:MAG: sugar phosphate nucleotidyltransferase [Egibacteraceae bacterium]